MLAASVCSKMDRDRFEPFVFFMENTKGEMPAVLDGLGVRHVCIGRNRLNKLFSRFIVANVLDRYEIDVLHVHHAAYYAQSCSGVRRSGVRGVVFTEHSWYALSQSHVLRNIFRAAAREATFCTAVSAEIQSYCVRKLGVPTSQVQVVLNGVDTSRFAPVSGSQGLRSLISLPSDSYVVFTVGRLHEAKDQLSLIQAMKILHQEQEKVHLVIGGDGPLRKDLEKSIVESGLSGVVHLLGNITDVDQLLPGADLFVLSSRREGLPMVLLEAMSCGLPIVSTNVGGIPELVVENKNGLLVSPEDPSQLALKIKILLQNKELAGKMGRRNRQRIKESFSLENTVKQYCAMYEKIME